METLIDLGYWGLFIGSFLASTIIPMSADILLLGVLSLGGNAWLCFGIATLGNWLGGLTSYGIGWIGKWEWIEKWFKIKEEKLIRQKKIHRPLRSMACILYLASFYRRLARHRIGILQNQSLHFRLMHADWATHPLLSMDTLIP